MPSNTYSLKIQMTYSQILINPQVPYQLNKVKLKKGDTKLHQKFIRRATDSVWKEAVAPTLIKNFGEILSFIRFFISY